MNAEDAILVSLAKRDRMAAECLADPDAASSEADKAILVDLAYDVARSVFDRRQHFGK
jgi:hypothetical protein